MELTKDEAVRLHREMWDWIAKQYDAGNKNTRSALKQQYLSEKGYYCGEIVNCCFCCEYATQQMKNEKDGCENCPVIWGSEPQNSDFFCMTEQIDFRTTDARTIRDLPTITVNIEPNQYKLTFRLNVF